MQLFVVLMYSYESACFGSKGATFCTSFYYAWVSVGTHFQTQQNKNCHFEPTFKDPPGLLRR